MTAPNCPKCGAKVSYEGAQGKILIRWFCGNSNSAATASYQPDECRIRELTAELRKLTGSDIEVCASPVEAAETGGPT